MDATKGLVQLLMWTFFTLAVIAIIGAWYLLAGIGTALILFIAYLVRQNRKAKASASVQPLEDGSLVATQRSMLTKAGWLILGEGRTLRVVETKKFAPQHLQVASKFQIERDETLVVDGFLLNSYEWVESENDGEERELIYATVGETVIGQLANLEMVEIYDQVFEAGGAVRCRIEMHFSGEGALKSAKVMENPPPTFS